MCGFGISDVALPIEMATLASTLDPPPRDSIVPSHMPANNDSPAVQLLVRNHVGVGSRAGSS